MCKKEACVNKADSFLKKISVFMVITFCYNFRARSRSCEVSQLLYVFLRFFFIVVISFSLRAMLPQVAGE